MLEYRAVDRVEKCLSDLKICLKIGLSDLKIGRNDLKIGLGALKIGPSSLKISRIEGAVKTGFTLAPKGNCCPVDGRPLPVSVHG